MIGLILLVFALVLFTVAAFNVPFRLNLVASGLAFYILYLLVGQAHLTR
jgi:hypothetical protein